MKTKAAPPVGASLLYDAATDTTWTQNADIRVVGFSRKRPRKIR